MRTALSSLLGVLLLLSSALPCAAAETTLAPMNFMYDPVTTETRRLEGRIFWEAEDVYVSHTLSPIDLQLLDFVTLSLADLKTGRMYVFRYDREENAIKGGYEFEEDGKEGQVALPTAAFAEERKDGAPATWVAAWKDAGIELTYSFPDPASKDVLVLSLSDAKTGGRYVIRYDHSKDEASGTAERP